MHWKPAPLSLSAMPLVSCVAASCASAGSCLTTASTKSCTSDPMVWMVLWIVPHSCEASKAAFLLCRSATSVWPAVASDVATSWRPRASESSMAPPEAMAEPRI